MTDFRVPNRVERATGSVIEVPVSLAPGRHGTMSEFARPLSALSDPPTADEVPVGDARVREHMVRVACRRFRSERR